MAVSTLRAKSKDIRARDGVSSAQRDGLSPGEAELLALLADKPLLSGEQIVALRTSSAAWTWRLLNHLEKSRLLRYSVPPGEVNVSAGRYYYLTGEGIRLAAKREGTRPGRYVREHWLSPSRLTMLFNSLDHTTASRQFFVDLMVQARKRRNEALEVWHDEAQAARRYRWHGDVRLIRPDGYGEYRKDGLFPFFLEWDSGNSGIKRHRRKLRAYHDYWAATGYQALPAILMVTTPDRVRQLNRAAVDVGRHRRGHLLPLLIAMNTEIKSCGAFGCRWWDVRAQTVITLEQVPDLWIRIS